MNYTFEEFYLSQIHSIELQIKVNQSGLDILNGLGSLNQSETKLHFTLTSNIAKLLNDKEEVYQILKDEEDRISDFLP